MINLNEQTLPNQALTIQLYWTIHSIISIFLLSLNCLLQKENAVMKLSPYNLKVGDEGLAYNSPPPAVVQSEYWIEVVEVFRRLFLSCTCTFISLTYGHRF